MKLAKYLSDLCGEIVLPFSEYRDNDPEYTRVSEIIEVEFTPLTPEVIVPAQLKVLDAAEAELRNKFNEKLSELNTRRANLLALTHQVQS